MQAAQYKGNITIQGTSDLALRWYCCCLQNLQGPLPNFGAEVANTFSELRISNTSLLQCEASHLAVYRDGLNGKTLRAGSSKAIGSENLTGC